DHDVMGSSSVAEHDDPASLLAAKTPAQATPERPHASTLMSHEQDHEQHGRGERHERHQPDHAELAHRPNAILRSREARRALPGKPRESTAELVENGYGCRNVAFFLSVQPFVSCCHRPRARHSSAPTKTCVRMSDCAPKAWP